MNAVMPGHSQFPPYNGVGLLPPEEGMDNLPPYNNNDNGTPHHHRPNSFGSNENPVPDNPNNGRVNHHGGAIPNNGGGGGNVINGKAGSENPMTTIPKHHSTSSAPSDYPPHRRFSNPPMSPPQRQMRSHQQQHLSPMGSPRGVPLPMPSPGAHSPAQGYGPNGVGVGLPMTPQFGLGVPSVPQQPPLFHDPLAASFPWSIGTTDGSFALVNLQQQQQQILIQQRQQEIERRQKQQQQQQQQQQEQLQQQQQDEDVPTEINMDNVTPSDSTQRSSILDTGGSSELTMHTKPPPSPAMAKRVAAAAAQEPPPPNPEIQKAQAAIAQSAAVVQQGRSIYHDQLFHQSSSSVEGVLAASCDVMGFDIAEMWLRTGLKTHQLTNSHLRPTALQDSVRQDLVEVYYGDKSNERTHRLSPALCKRAKDANDVVWVTAHTQTGAEALRMSISNVRTAVAVPLCHEASNTNVTILYFSMRRIVLQPSSVEFLIHMSLSAAVASVNALSTNGLIDRPDGGRPSTGPRLKTLSAGAAPFPEGESLSKTTDGVRSKPDAHAHHRTVAQYRRADKTSITGARLDLQWKQLLNAEYLTDGGNSWIHTAVFDGKPVVVKTLRPECQDTAVAINEIESEVAIHARLNHPNIVALVGAGHTKRNVRFIVLERLDGGTLTQMLGYDTRIRDRRRRFWKKKQLPYLDVLRCARSLACAMQYCHEKAIPGSMVLHRDLKPDNIGFTLDGQVKLLDFGLARILENSDPSSNERYEMSGETGSLRYMAPEVAEGLPYNHKADVYSFGIIFWEMNAGKRPFNNLGRDTFYEQVVHGCGRPHLSKKWPADLTKLISDCWNVDVDARPTFGQIVDRIDDLLTNEKGGRNTPTAGKKAMQSISRIIDRHSTWF